MDRLVRLLAPHSVTGLVVRSVLLTLGLGLLVTLEQYLFHEQDLHALEHIAKLFILIGLPVVALMLAVIGRLDRAQRQLAVLATTDLLTGLPNRRAFFERGEALGERGKVVLMVDIDHFKEINDRFGHAAGDRCLVALADRLRELHETGHLVGRIGGEEFALVLADVTRPEARQIGERLARGFVVDPDDPPGEPIPMTVSVGASCRARAQSLDEALHRADLALYEAKRAGRSRLCFWLPPDEPGEGHDPPPAIAAA